MYGLYVGRMFSPMGRNVCLCCSKYGVPIAQFNTSKVIRNNYLCAVFIELKAKTDVPYEVVIYGWYFPYP